jgi:hypothetical protein
MKRRARKKRVRKKKVRTRKARKKRYVNGLPKPTWTNGSASMSLP